MGDTRWVYLLILTAAVTVQAVSIPGDHHLHSALHYFDTLHKVTDIRQRTPRGTEPHPSGDNPKIVQFYTLGRNFKLFLRPHTKPFHPRSRVQYGAAHKPIDIYQYHHGHVINEERSHVIAHLSNDGLLTAIIMTTNESYYIEPSSRHFTESHDFHMISYRGSDLKFNLSGEPLGDYCGVVDHEDLHHHLPGGIHDDHTYSKLTDHAQSTDGHTRGRLKRQATVIEADTVCPVNLVATTSFVDHFGAGNDDHTVNFLLVLLLQIDAIYRSTDWFIPGVSGTVSPGVRGIQIANVLVHSSTDGTPEYNSRTDWTSDDLLREFAKTDWSDYCLAHLFTASLFTDSRRLGVAYTAFADSLRAGGICSRRTTYQSEPFSGNVGASNYRGSERFLVLAEAVVVTAHEFGHSWGSGHDPDTSECSPPFNPNGGKYLMYAFAQDGQSRNNKIFSNCSRQAISLVLNTHERECFVEPSASRCGDYIVDSDEECDPGPTRILQGGDDCCTDQCTLKTNANGVKYNCSDANHDCCFNCVPSPVGQVCREEEVGNLNCFGNSTCDGGIVCPETSTYVPEGTACGVMGECRSTGSQTVCTNFCELNNLTTCFCTDSNECMLCCRDNAINGSCNPYFPSTALPKGRFCEGGTCNGQGTCEPSDPDLSTYLFDLLTDFNTAAFVRFLEENIVGVVIILSLVVWIPISIAVHLFDVYLEKRQAKKKQEQQEKAEEKKRKKRQRVAAGSLLRRGTPHDVDVTTPLLANQPTELPPLVDSSTNPRNFDNRIHPMPTLPPVGGSHSVTQV